MKAYCEGQGLPVRQPINDTDTPAQVEREDEDTTDVFWQQTGGIHYEGNLLLYPELGSSRPRRHSQLEHRHFPHPHSLIVHKLTVVHAQHLHFVK